MTKWTERTEPFNAEREYRVQSSDDIVKKVSGLYVSGYINLY